MNLDPIYEATLNGNANVAEAEVNTALVAKIPPADILHQTCTPIIGVLKS